jgi:hypothetical protein
VLFLADDSEEFLRRRRILEGIDHEHGVTSDYESGIGPRLVGLRCRIFDCGPGAVVQRLQQEVFGGLGAADRARTKAES